MASIVDEEITVDDRSESIYFSLDNINDPAAAAPAMLPITSSITSTSSYSVYHETSESSGVPGDISSTSSHTGLPVQAVKFPSPPKVKRYPSPSRPRTSFSPDTFISGFVSDIEDPTDDHSVKEKPSKRVKFDPSLDSTSPSPSPYDEAIGTNIQHRRHYCLTLTWWRSFCTEIGKLCQDFGKWCNESETYLGKWTVFVVILSFTLFCPLSIILSLMALNFAYKAYQSEDETRYRKKKVICTYCSFAVSVVWILAIVIGLFLILYLKLK